MNRLATRLSVLCGITCVLWFNTSAWAQGVIQLPSFRTFSYSGTVQVPVSGGAYLGGVKRSASGSSRRGSSRSFGSSLGNSGAAISATIIDNAAIDEQILGTTPQRFARQRPPGRPAANPVDEGKALVRHARRQYRAGDRGAAFDTYRMAIDILNGRLRELAILEFRRVFGTAAEQSLRSAAVARARRS